MPVQAHSLEEADCIRIIPQQHKGQGDIIKLDKKIPSQLSTWAFNYQRDTYSVLSTSPITFGRLPYPSTSKPQLGTFLQSKGLSRKQIPEHEGHYGTNESFHLIHARRLQMHSGMAGNFICYHAYALAYICTVRSNFDGVQNYVCCPLPHKCYRDSKWIEIQTDKLLPGDIISVGM